MRRNRKSHSLLKTKIKWKEILDHNTPLKKKYSIKPKINGEANKEASLKPKEKNCKVSKNKESIFII